MKDSPIPNLAKSASEVNAAVPARIDSQCAGYRKLNNKPVYVQYLFALKDFGNVRRRLEELRELPLSVAELLELEAEISRFLLLTFDARPEEDVAALPVELRQLALDRLAVLERLVAA
jgi:hypothetical protein